MTRSSPPYTTNIEYIEHSIDSQKCAFPLVWPRDVLPILIAESGGKTGGKIGMLVST